MGSLIAGKSKADWFREIREFLCYYGYSPHSWPTLYAALSVLANERITSRESAVKLYIALRGGEATIHADIFEKRFANPLKQIKKAEASRRAKSNHLKSARSNFYNSRGWRKLRYETLIRYGAKCMCCGNTNGPFNVDHIKPIKKYWHLRLDPENTQVLCDRCNLGKGSWDETDFRPTTNPEESHSETLTELSEEYALLVEAKSYGEN